MIRATIGVYWWAPAREPRELAREVRDHWRSWSRLAIIGRPFYNFGDVLSAELIPALTGRSVKWAPLTKADLLGAGSVLNAAADASFGGLVWGSGVRTPNAFNAPALNDCTVLAVRGPLTASALGRTSEVAFGDPGILAPRLIAQRSAVRRQQRVYLPHFRAWNSVAGRKTIGQMKESGFTVLPPNRPVREMARAIAGVDYLVTSSLHGMIFAHALGTPVTLMGSVEAGEPTFKYDDYAAGIGIPTVSSVNVGDFIDKKEVRDRAEEHARDIRRHVEEHSAGAADRLQKRITDAL